MAQVHQTAFIASLLLTLLHLLTTGVSSTTFIMVNKCEYTVWPGILSNAGVSPLSVTGFELQSGQSKSITAPSSWGGRFWGRTHCSEDPTTGKFSCVTGDCGSGKLECLGSGATPPATLAEITLDGHGGLDFYDVSLVDGYNIPMLFSPQAGGAGANCTSTGCVGDLNGACPSELRVSAVSSGDGVACRSACDAFKTPQYCCSGAYGSPDTCKPSSYSQIFKSACPRAYSYAYDDNSSTFTCSAVESYTITFCPSPNTSQKASQDGQNTQQLTNGHINSTMVYEGALDATDNGSPSTCPHMMSLISFTVAVWLLFQLLF